MMKEEKTLSLSEEEINRQNRMKRRFLWLFITLDIFLVTYIIYQLVMLFS